MKKLLTFFGIICLIILSVNIAVSAPVDTITVTKIKYTLNGMESGEITLETPVTIYVYADGSAKAPVKIYDFPNAMDGTITSVDMYINVASGPVGWWTSLLAQNLAKDGITVTSNTQEIYVGAEFIEQADPRVVNPGTI